MEVIQAIPENSGFVRLLGQVPLVESTVSMVSDTYSRSKEYRLLRLPLTVAESGVRVAASTAQFAATPAMPLLNKLVPTLKTLDEKAETKLRDSMESHPSMMKSPTELRQGVQDYTQEKVQQVRDLRDRQLNWALETGKHVLDTAMDTSVGRVASRTSHACLDQLEDLVNKNLPAPEGEAEPEGPQPTYAVQRLLRLNSTARHRLYCRAQKDLQEAKKLSSAFLTNIDNTIHLVERVQATQEKWQQFISNPNEHPETLEQRLVETTRMVARQLNDSALTVANFSKKFHPSNASQTMEEAVNFAHNLLESVKKAPGAALEVPSWALQKLREAAVSLSQLPASVLHTLSDVDLEGVPLEGEDIAVNDINMLWE